MSSTLYQSIAGALNITLTVLSGAGGFALGRYICDEYQKPKIKIIRTDELSRPESHMKFWKVVVENKGRTDAEYCTGNIHMYGFNTGTQKSDIKGAVCWSILGNPNALSINISDGQALDIYRVLEERGDIFIQIPTELGWVPLRDTIYNLEQAKITIRITSRNAKPYEKTFNIVRQNHKIVMIE